VVIGIVAVLAAVAIPNMVSWRKKQQFLSATNSVHDAIKSARAYTIKFNTSVVIELEGSSYSVKKQGGSKINAGSFPSGISFPDGTKYTLTFDSRGFATGVPAEGITVKADGYANRVIEVTVLGNSRVR